VPNSVDLNNLTLPRAAPEKKMTKRLCLGLCAAGLMFMQAPAFSYAAVSQSSAERLERACATEARWPVSESTPYKNGSLRLREALENSYNADVTAVSRICREFDRADARSEVKAAKDCETYIAERSQSATRAEKAHLERTAAICSALSQSFSN